MSSSTATKQAESGPVALAATSCLDPFEQFVRSVREQQSALALDPAAEDDTVQVQFSQDYDKESFSLSFYNDSEDDDQSSTGTLSRTTSETAHTFLAPPSPASPSAASSRAPKRISTLARNKPQPINAMSSRSEYHDHPRGRPVSPTSGGRGRSQPTASSSTARRTSSPATSPPPPPPPSSYPSKPLRSSTEPMHPSSRSVAPSASSFTDHEDDDEDGPARSRSSSLPTAHSSTGPCSPSPSTPSPAAVASSSRHPLRTVSTRRASDPNSTPPTSPQPPSSAYVQPYSSPNRRQLAPKSDCNTLKPLSPTIRECARPFYSSLHV